MSGYCVTTVSEPFGRYFNQVADVECLFHSFTIAGAESGSKIATSRKDSFEECCSTRANGAR
jgi:hypothetical protein